MNVHPVLPVHRAECGGSRCYCMYIGRTGTVHIGRHIGARERKRTLYSTFPLVWVYMGSRGVNKLEPVVFVQ